MKSVDIFIGAVTLLFSGLVITQSAQLEFFQRGGIPGPGFLPTLLAAAMAIIGLLLVLSRSIGRAEEFGEFTAPTGAHVRRSLIVWTAFTVSILLFNIIGFLISSMLLIAVLLLLVERLRSVGALLAILLIPLIAHVVFALMLRVPLPAGPWGF